MQIERANYNKLWHKQIIDISFYVFYPQKEFSHDTGYSEM
jgi:hypothetical protein